MKIKTVQNVNSITAIPLHPSDFTTSEIIEIEIKGKQSKDSEIAALVLAELSESVGNDGYYQDPTIGKLSIALNSVVKAMKSIELHEDLADANHEREKGYLQFSLTNIQEAIKDLQSFEDYLEDVLEQVHKPGAIAAN